jgi:hypothetical protein
MNSRLARYLRAVESGTTEAYHDSQDVHKCKMKVSEYKRKHKGDV